LFLVFYFNFYFSEQMIIITIIFFGKFDWHFHFFLAYIFAFVFSLHASIFASIQIDIQPCQSANRQRRRIYFKINRSNRMPNFGGFFNFISGDFPPFCPFLDSTVVQLLILSASLYSLYFLFCFFFILFFFALY